MTSATNGETAGEPEGLPIEADRPVADRHRRRASYLYGLIVSGAVLAAASENYRIARVALGLLLTLVIYWASETYVHWMAARAEHRRDLTPAERRAIVADGWPLVTACAVPLVILLVEAALGVDSSIAFDVALWANSGLLVLVGYLMSRDSGLTGWRLVASSLLAGALGLAIIGLKTLLK
jgi:hypothetical protein